MKKVVIILSVFALIASSCGNKKIPFDHTTLPSEWIQLTEVNDELVVCESPFQAWKIDGNTLLWIYFARDEQSDSEYKILESYQIGDTVVIRAKPTDEEWTADFKIIWLDKDKGLAEWFFNDKSNVVGTYVVGEKLHEFPNIKCYDYDDEDDEMEDLLDHDYFGNKQNPLYGKIYRDITDIPELKHLKDHGGRIIEADDRFGINYFIDDNKNIVCTFEEFTPHDENGRSKYKILDTVHIGKLKDREYFMLSCIQDNTIWDSEIIAVIIVEDDDDFADKELFDKIVKAWRMDTRTGRIKLIENLKGLVAINEGYGV